MGNNLLNGDQTTPVFRQGIKDPIDTPYAVNILSKQIFNSNQICSKNPLRPCINAIFIIDKNAIGHERDVFSDDLGHWVKSKTKTFRFGQKDEIVQKVAEGEEYLYDRTFDVFRYIHYFKNSPDLHRVTTFVDKLDYILQYSIILMVNNT